MVTMGKNGEISVNTFSLLGLKHGFGTKHSLDPDFPKAQKIVPKQIHSTHITYINHLEDSKKTLYISDCDGLITNLPNVLLTVQTADCVPIIYFDPDRRIIGISHQGWKGTLNGLAQKMIQRMVKYGSDPKKIYCALGPCVQPCCYKIYGNRKTRFLDRFGNNSTYFVQKKTHCGLDLQALNTSLLVNEEVSEKNIYQHTDCTACNSDDYYSYTREQNALSKQMTHYVML